MVGRNLRDSAIAVEGALWQLLLSLKVDMHTLCSRRRSLIRGRDPPLKTPDGCSDADMSPTTNIGVPQILKIMLNGHSDIKTILEMLQTSYLTRILVTSR